MSSSNKPVRPPPKPSNLKFVRAQFAYQGQEADELSFSEVNKKVVSKIIFASSCFPNSTAQGDLLYILDDKSDSDWWRARCRGKEGLVPANYLRTSQEDAAPGGTTRREKATTCN